MILAWMKERGDELISRQVRCAAECLSQDTGLIVVELTVAWTEEARREGTRDC